MILGLEVGSLVHHRGPFFVILKIVCIYVFYFIWAVEQTEIILKYLQSKFLLPF